MMKLFHGSNVDFKEIDLLMSKVGKDFGCGFYLSPDRQQAEDLAGRKVEQKVEGKAYVHEFELDEKCLSDGTLNVLRFEGYTREWAEFVLQNRKNRTRNQVHPYDVVIGPIANDTVGLQIRRFTQGIITIGRFIEELSYMKGVTYQYFFGTEKSVKQLRKL